MSENRGLTEAEATQARARGEGNRTDFHTSRTYLAIARANLFNFFNNILFVIGVALVALGEINDAMTSVGLGLVNALISTAQEVRAKRQLDRIALLNLPTVTLLRDGRVRAGVPAVIVRGDHILIRPGDQVVADGSLVLAQSLEIDESLLTGESEPVAKRAGDRVLSGSICAGGSGTYRADVVGAQSYANRLATDARRFQILQTPLQKQIEFSVRVVMLVVALISGVILVAAILKSAPAVRIVQLAAVLSGQVPYGLFFVIVVAYSLSAARIGKKGALVQQINAIESLSDADVLCLDKTGTLTTNRLVYKKLEPLGEINLQAAEAALGTFAHSVSTPNQTLNAIREALPGAAHPRSDEIAFSSQRKWSAVAITGGGPVSGVLALGAYDMLAPHLAQPKASGSIADRVAENTAKGWRVLLLAGNADTSVLRDGSGQPILPPLTPLALVALADELRPNVRETFAALKELGVGVKIISGDDPRTVGALARQAGLQHPLLASGPELDGMGPEEFRQAVEESSIFGRIAPAQKQRIVQTLIDAGHHVAMIGDGVNDVLALKTAQLGIAMRSGSAATRNVADMVLLDDDFAPLIPAFSEGQRVSVGMANSLMLFLARVASSVLLIIAVTMLGLAFPFEPDQVALTVFTVGLPTLFLTFWAKPKRSTGDLITKLVRFVVPVGIVTMVIGVAIYTFQYNRVLSGVANYAFPSRVIDLFERATGLKYVAGDQFGTAAATIVAQSTLSIFATFTAFLLILFLEPPSRMFTGWRKDVSADKRPAFLSALLALVFLLVITTPLGGYFGLITIGPGIYLTLAAVLPLWMFALRANWRKGWFDRFLWLDQPPDRNAGLEEPHASRPSKQTQTDADRSP